MDVYYYLQFQLCITSGSKISRGVQNCTPPGIGCVQTPRNSVNRDQTRASKVLLRKRAINFEVDVLDTVNIYTM